jgi:hypothetical protein
MALIVKSLVGKMFPIFSTFGKKISSMPKQMGKNIDKLETKIQRLNSTMVKGSKVTASMIKKQAEQILEPDQRGGAFGKNTMKSVGTSLRAARKALKDGEVGGKGGLAGITEKQLIEKEKLYENLNKTVSKGLPLQIKATKNIHRFQQAVLGAKKSVTQFGANHIKTWTAVTRTVNQHGLYAGLGMAVRQIGNQWTYAATRATVYGKVVSSLAMITQTAVSSAALIGKAIGKAGAIGMAIYGLYQIGKLVVGIFWDLDTPFIRAAAAADELNSSLEKSLEAINEMDPRLRM